jgi:hypothetical protein
MCGVVQEIEPKTSTRLGIPSACPHFTPLKTILANDLHVEYTMHNVLLVEKIIVLTLSLQAILTTYV